MREMDPWKMCESKKGDPEVGERFYVWKMQEGSWWISGTSGGVVWRGGNDTDTDTDTDTVFISFRFAAKAELHEWGQY